MDGRQERPSRGWFRRDIDKYRRGLGVSIAIGQAAFLGLIVQLAVSFPAHAPLLGLVVGLVVWVGASVVLLRRRVGR